jgi:hypothetical protein
MLLHVSQQTKFKEFLIATSMNEVQGVTEGGCSSQLIACIGRSIEMQKLVSER